MMVRGQINIKEKEQDYVLISEGGISIEQFDSTYINPNRYTKNNTTFSEGTVFTYAFKHITANNKKLLFTSDESVDNWKFDWKFVPTDSIDENTVKKVIITVKAGLEPMIQHIPDYNQTIIQFEYKTESGNVPFNSMSGVIENENNIWMHPPRDKYFRILELNPFPFIKAPYEIGNAWDWTLIVGSGWGDHRWKLWEGHLENQCKYVIKDKINLKTKLGEIECLVIESTASSSVGNTKLTSYFNAEFGFVKLDYLNIDGSKTKLELVEHSRKQNGR
jgi:hypothetical protein